MQPSLGTLKPCADEPRGRLSGHTSTPMTGAEVLKAAMTTEGMPVEWAFDYTQMRQGSLS